MESQGDILQQIFDSLVDNFQSAFCSVFGTFCLSHATIDPPPLAVGYSITTAGALFLVAGFIHLGITHGDREFLAIGFAPLVCCVLPAFFVPLLVLSQS